MTQKRTTFIEILIFRRKKHNFSVSDVSYNNLKKCNIQKKGVFLVSTGVKMLYKMCNPLTLKP